MNVNSSTSPKLIALLLCPTSPTGSMEATLTPDGEILELTASPLPLSHEAVHARFLDDQRLPLWALLFHPKRWRPGSTQSLEGDFTIKYIFDNKTLVDAKEILYHPYSQFLPTEALPISQIFSPWNPAGTSQLTSNELQQSLIELFWRVTEQGPFKPSLKNIRSLVGYFPSVSTAHVWPVKEIEFLKTSANSVPQLRPLVRGKIRLRDQELLLTLAPAKQPKTTKSMLGIASLTLVCKDFPSQGLAGENYYFDCTTGVLTFHHLMSAFKHFYDLVEGAPPLKTLPSSISVDLVGHQKITETVNQLVSKLNLELETAMDIVEVAQEQVKSEFYFSDTQVAFSQRFEVGGQEYSIWNFNSTIEDLVLILIDGLQGAPRISDYQLRKRRRDSKREFDLKVIRHRGLAYFFVFKSLSFILENFSKINDISQGPDGIKKFLDETFQEMGRILRKQAGWDAQKQNKSLKDLCSKQLIESLSATFHDWLEATLLPQSIYDETEIFNIHGNAAALFQLILAQLKSLLIITRGELFTRPAKSYFTPIRLRRPVYTVGGGTPGPGEGAWEWYEYGSGGVQSHELPPMLLTKGTVPRHTFAAYDFVEPKVAASPEFQPWMLMASEPNTSIFMNGKPLQMLNTEMFKASLTLNDSGGEADTTATGSIDWFALNPQFFFNGKEVQLNDLQFHHGRLIEFENRLYLIDEKKQLPSIRALNWFWQRLSATGLKSGRNRLENSFLQLPKHETLELLALRASGVPITGGQEWQQICQFYDNLNQPRAGLDLSIGFHGELKIYQNAGVHWLNDLYQLKMGGILADDMGLGKTVQALAFLELLRQQGQFQRALIIVPTSLSYNWLEEASRFTPELPLFRFLSTRIDELKLFLAEQNPAVVLVSYGRFFENQEFFQSYSWDIHIYDEAQNLKNIRAKRTHAARAVPAKFKLCMTGTPMENHFDELYSLVDLVVPGALGKYSQFLSTYVRNENLSVDDLEFLKLKVKPLILRRHKSQILSELPARVDQVLKIPFESQQKRIYRDIAVSWNNKIKDVLSDKKETESQLEMLTALLRLRQTCSDPASIPGVKYSKIPPKLVVLIEAIKEIIENGESVLVFTQFLGTLSHIERLLKQAEMPHYIMHGGLSQKKRETVLKGFDRDERGSVFLMTLKTGGVGLNLTKANYVFHIEPWWNPAVENQATDRVHRIGQDKSVKVYRYIMHNSVEEKVEMLKDRKAKRFVSLFGEGESTDSIRQGTDHITREDFLYLIT